MLQTLSTSIKTLIGNEINLEDHWKLIKILYNYYLVWNCEL